MTKERTERIAAALHVLVDEVFAPLLASMAAGEAVERSEEPAGDDGWMNAREAASYMAVSSRTVQKWANEGRLKGRKTGRHWKFKRSACDRAVKRG